MGILPKKNKTSLFPPVVTVLGHVDHGKTTLLDAIRKTTIAEREHGGITQRIGASSVTILHEGGERRITFIDTPGHEAFTKMRSRGAQAADIGLLIVSSVDGVMPQTKESMVLLKDSQVPFIVVLTKSDVSDKNTEKAKQQLLKENVLLEGLGGDIPFIEVSAKTGKNIHELLDLILLFYDLHIASIQDGADTQPFSAIVIESRLDQKSGPKATAVVKQGSIHLREEIICEDTMARVRALVSSDGKQLKEASVGDAVEILGFEAVPPVGGVIKEKKDLPPRKTPQTPITQKEYSPTVAEGVLPIVLSADTVGSLEAIVASLPAEKIEFIEKKTGEITPADILLAKSVGAIVLGFNSNLRSDVVHLASVEKVLLKNYRIIYELIEEVKDVLAGKALALEEKIYGAAKILARFPFEKTSVAGIRVLNGRIAKGDKVRLEREGQTVGESTITSLRQGKEQVSKVEQGHEGGIILFPFLDFTIGDMVISHG